MIDAERQFSVTSSLQVVARHGLLDTNAAVCVVASTVPSFSKSQAHAFGVGVVVSVKSQTVGASGLVVNDGLSRSVWI